MYKMDKNHQQRFNNQAFVPYAINGDETTYIPNGKMDTLTDCKDDGYVKPFLNAQSSKDHEYENPAEVAERAGLSRAGSGPRRKNNQLYGDSKKMRVELPEAPPSPVGTNGAAERSPLVVTVTEKKRSEKKRCSAKIMIPLILVFLLSAGALALSLMNMLQKNGSCLCSTREIKAAPVVSINERVDRLSDPSLAKRLDELERKCKKLQDQIEKQSQELERVNKSASSKPKLLRSNPGPRGLQGPKGDPGLQGIQGIQGIQGVPGMINMSRCSHKTLENSDSIQKTARDTYVMVQYKVPQGTKVMSVTCSTKLNNGASNSYLRSSALNNGQMKYICDCAGASVNGPFGPSSDGKMECVMHIWECRL